MMQYSAHGLNDLGNQPDCNALSPSTNTTLPFDFPNSTYITLNINISTVPIFFRQGACLPAQCTQGMYIEFSKKASVFVTKIFRAVITRLNVNFYVFPPDIDVEVSLINPELAVRQKSAYFEQVAPTQLAYGFYPP
jgi:hypothetical protein